MPNWIRKAWPRGPEAVGVRSESSPGSLVDLAPAARDPDAGRPDRDRPALRCPIGSGKHGRGGQRLLGSDRNRVLARWSTSRRQHGTLTLDDLIEIAQLSDAQLDPESMAEGARVCWGQIGIVSWLAGRPRAGSTGP